MAGKVDAKRRSPAKGRPKLPPEAKRSHVVEVGLNAAERAKVVALAKRRGMPPAAYLRERGLDLELPPAVDGVALDADALDALNGLWLQLSRLRQELSPIGNNANQIAAALHQDRLLAGSVASLASELAVAIAETRGVVAKAELLLNRWVTE